MVTAALVKSAYFQVSHGGLIPALFGIASPPTLKIASTMGLKKVAVLVYSPALQRHVV